MTKLKTGLYAGLERDSLSVVVGKIKKAVGPEALAQCLAAIDAFENPAKVPGGWTKDRPRAGEVARKVSIATRIAREMVASGVIKTEHQDLHAERLIFGNRQRRGRPKASAALLQLKARITTILARAGSKDAKQHAFNLIEARGYTLPRPIDHRVRSSTRSPGNAEAIALLTRWKPRRT